MEPLAESISAVNSKSCAGAGLGVCSNPNAQAINKIDCRRTWTSLTSPPILLDWAAKLGRSRGMTLKRAIFALRACSVPLWFFSDKRIRVDDLDRHHWIEHAKVGAVITVR